MQSGGGPAELTSTVWNLVKMGTDAGVVIVAAAGNGNKNLDSSEFASYRARGDSGAIIVGSGMPAHNHDGWSTFGARVDVQAWGEQVMTAGFGECVGFEGYNVSGSRYTNTFDGTSAACAIVAGLVFARILCPFHAQRDPEFAAYHGLSTDVGRTQWTHWEPHQSAGSCGAGTHTGHDGQEGH